jgi:hypothetical protein
MHYKFKCICLIFYSLIAGQDTDLIQGIESWTIKKSKKYLATLSSLREREKEREKERDTERERERERRCPMASKFDGDTERKGYVGHASASVQTRMRNF